MKLKKLPIGISTLKTIIEEDYIYVDKTKIAQNLIENGQYYFISRPRRFGKSLFLDTLRTIFNADEEVFKDLYIGNNGYKFEKYPTIHISFGSGAGKSKKEYEQKIYEILQNNQKSLDIRCDTNLSSSGCFENLIRKAYDSYNKKVVVLIDEYDKPILDNIEDQEVAKLMKEELKNFYSVIKENDAYIKFVFITGVSKFSKVPLFSGLNNIQDITLHPKYSTLCGYTQNDLEITFAKYLKGQDFEKIKLWYNGYKFLGEGVYNPFNILLFISNEFIYRSYWFSIATPTFLLKIIEKNNYFLPNLENVIKDEMMLNSFDVDYIELETLMWQTGYLTIESTETILDNIEYHLTIPNKEIQQALLGSVADFITKNQNTTAQTNGIIKALLKNDFKTFEIRFKSLFASIPYNHFTNNKMYQYEGYYVSVFYSYLKALGAELIGEDVTNKGRIDLTLIFPNSIYIIEFKVDNSSVIEQIKEKNYHEKYIGEKKDIFIVGIEFDSKQKNIKRLEYEKIEQ